MKTVTFFLLGLLCNTSVAQQTRILQADQVEESCHKLPVRQTIHYRFSADQPLEFNIHYHQDNQVLFPLKPAILKTIPPSQFTAPVSATYCLMWHNKSTTATKLRFTVEKN